MSASNAATQASNANSYAQAAKTSENNARDSASNAEQSVSRAGSYADQAYNSAVSAGLSEANIRALLEDFEGVDPSTSPILAFLEQLYELIKDRTTYLSLLDSSGNAIQDSDGTDLISKLVGLDSFAYDYDKLNETVKSNYISLDARISMIESELASFKTSMLTFPLTDSSEDNVCDSSGAAISGRIAYITN